MMIDATCNTRLDLFLREKLPTLLKEPKCDISNSKIRRLIVAGCVYVNNKKITRPSFILKSKDKVFIQFDQKKFFYEKKADDIEFTLTSKDVLFENDDLIFINKPAGFPMEQTITKNRDNLHDCVVNFLWQKNQNLRNPPYVGIMHRLDKETSGVVLFTKNRSVNKDISQMFLSHDFEKKYVAIVQKNEKYRVGQTFAVEMFMERVSLKSQQGKWGEVSEQKGGKYSKTEFTILKEVKIENKNCFLVECNLFTGRTHQIRVHLSAKNMPILGDVLYGGCEAKRMYLHAKKMASYIECDNQNLKFEVNAPVLW